MLLRATPLSLPCTDEARIRTMATSPKWEGERWDVRSSQSSQVYEMHVCTIHINRFEAGKHP
jgi:hypothetical protein